MAKRKKKKVINTIPIGTPLGQIKVNEEVAEESFVDWTKDRLDKDEK